MRRPTFHKEKNDSPGFDRKVGLAGSQWVAGAGLCLNLLLGRVSLAERGKGQPAKARLPGQGLGNRCRLRCLSIHYDRLYGRRLGFSYFIEHNDGLRTTMLLIPWLWLMLALIFQAHRS